MRPSPSLPGHIGPRANQSSTLHTLHQIHRHFERLEWTQFSGPIQRHVAIRNHRRIKSLAFKTRCDHITSLKDLSRFTSLNLSNIAWAYATAGKSHPRMFKRFANLIVALKDLSDFNSQNLSNISWAYL